MESVWCVDVAEDRTAGEEVVESTADSSLHTQPMRVFRYRRGTLGFDWGPGEGLAVTWNSSRSESRKPWLSRVANSRISLTK